MHLLAFGIKDYLMMITFLKKKNPLQLSAHCKLDWETPY